MVRRGGKTTCYNKKEDKLVFNEDKAHIPRAQPALPAEDLWENNLLGVLVQLHCVWLRTSAAKGDAVLRSAFLWHPQPCECPRGPQQVVSSPFPLI